jgi:hypothetical protein
MSSERDDGGPAGGNGERAMSAGCRQQRDDDRREQQRARLGRLDEGGAHRGARKADVAEPRRPRDGDLAVVEDDFFNFTHRRFLRLALCGGR